MRPLHHICWVDLGTADPSRTARFYAGLFGWTVTEPDADGYRICLQDGRPVAGLGPSEGTGEPHWTVNVRVDEVAATARAVVAAGGMLPVPPTRAGEHGAYAVAVDPVGAPLSLWQPGTWAGLDEPGVPGTFAAARLLTGELPAAFRLVAATAARVGAA